jgi:hypothetical protein
MFGFPPLPFLVFSSPVLFEGSLQRRQPVQVLSVARKVEQLAILLCWWCMVSSFCGKRSALFIRFNRCFDRYSCDERMRQSPNLMTSTLLARERKNRIFSCCIVLDFDTISCSDCGHGSFAWIGQRSLWKLEQGSRQISFPFDAVE